MANCGSTRVWSVAGIAGLLGLLLAHGASAGDIPTGPVAAERAVVLFEDGAFELVERVPVRTVLPPFDGLPDDGREHSGFWYELQDANGDVRYRRFMGNPIPMTFEGPDPVAESSLDGGGRTPVRVEHIPARRVFSVLIPAAQQGDQLVIFSSPLEPGQQFRAATEVARIDLVPVVIP